MIVLTNIPVPTEEVLHPEVVTQAFIENVDVGRGTLYINDWNLTWINSDPERSFAVDYRRVFSYGLTTGQAEGQEASLRLTIDNESMRPEFETEGHQAAPPLETGAGDTGSDGITNVKFIPDDKSVVYSLYSAISNTSGLHLEPYVDDELEDEQLYMDYESYYGSDEFMEREVQDPMGRGSEDESGERYGNDLEAGEEAQDEDNDEDKDEEEEEEGVEEEEEEELVSDSDEVSSAYEDARSEDEGAVNEDEGAVNEDEGAVNEDEGAVNEDGDEVGETEETDYEDFDDEDSVSGDGSVPRRSLTGYRNGETTNSYLDHHSRVEVVLDIILPRIEEPYGDDDVPNAVDE